MNDARWATLPNPDDMPQSWKILRTPKTGVHNALVLSDDTTGCYVHYWEGRTQPCWEHDCGPCEKGNVARWRGYLAVLIGPSRMTKILEVTPSAVNSIIRFRKEWNTLRGALISLTRKGKAANGELECVFSEKPVSGANLPSAPELGSHLKRIWRATHAPKPSELSFDPLTLARRSGIVPSANGKH